MKIYTYHAKVKKDFDVTNLISQLTSQEEIKLVAIKRNYEEDLKKRLSNLKIKVDFPIFSDPFLEILLSESEKILISIHVSAPRTLEIKVLSESKDKFTLLLELIKSFNGVEKVNYGTFSESKEIEKLKKVLKLSPHGKKLINKKYKKVFPKIYDHKIREILSEIIETFSGIPVPIEVLKDIETVKREGKTADRIFKDNTLTSKSYMITCSKCYGPSFVTFNTTAGANKALKNAQYICPRCKKSSPEIVETFYVKEEVIHVLRGGLWLENFIDQVMREETENVWSGVTIDTNELDTVAILNERTFLIECKDTSFGQNDLYILMEKARMVDANIVIIVTTKEIHENVKLVITKYQEEGERKIYLIKSNNTEKIYLELQNILRKDRERYTKAVFKPERESLPEIWRQVRGLRSVRW